MSVSTYNATTFLETFFANFPTVIFWDPNFFELRESAKYYYDDLREVGILHDSPESAAAKVNEVYMDPISWWMSEKIQTSKKKFCSRFSRSGTNWISHWREEFLKVESDCEPKK